MKDIRELAKARRAEFDALKTENMDLREKRDKATALITELEKATNISTVKAALAGYGKKAKP
jgi:hypothetical protein